MATEGIDVSRYQGTVNWQQVAAAGKRFAMLRAGYGRETDQVDPYFVRNYNGAVAAGLQVGCYWYSYATTVARARAEAEACLQALGDRQFPMGVWFDQEYETGILALTNAQRTAIVRAFLARIRQAGYTAGLYCSADWLRTKLTTTQFTGENLWIAQYASALNAPLPVAIWQYTDTGRVAGVSGNVDLDRQYRPIDGDRGPLPALGSATIRPGDRGEYVENLQIVLAALGYQPGTADGIFGARTEAALRAFQTDAGLAADGLAGSRTKAALRTAWNRTGAAGRSIPDGMGCCYRGCM